ncbi:hypothetical protein L227DRAFT_381159 [Lentinus tigrinus ALCF2SS1-6]|uniref:Uncharacterized protein n=1 Tax=Lentinus tigrinus ALCF2SS1-6 TaxID=1328759 RepID=A0A5C2RRC5_9APHY|nr:hypothetical protein L227DRAFT_381159 [Lentinus tigrinus ALCF2SS1-6]
MNGRGSTFGSPSAQGDFCCVSTVQGVQRPPRLRCRDSEGVCSRESGKRDRVEGGQLEGREHRPYQAYGRNEGSEAGGCGCQCSREGTRSPGLYGTIALPGSRDWYYVQFPSLTSMLLARDVFQVQGSCERHAALALGDPVIQFGLRAWCQLRSVLYGENGIK